MGNKKLKETNELTEDEILHLCIISGFSKEEILFFYQNFIADCPSGKLPKKDFQSMYKKIYPNSKSNKFSSRIFDVYDRNKDGFLDFEEFLIANKITSGNNLNEKLKMAFEIYDLKNDGVLDKKEMLDTFINIYTTVNIDSKENRKMAKEKVNIIFSKFVTKGNLLTLEEFIQCYSSDKHLNNVLNGTFLKEKPKISIQPRNQREFHMEKIERVLSI